MPFREICLVKTIYLNVFNSKSRNLCSDRIPEAALMARSYLPSKVSEIVALWRKDLNKVMAYVISWF